MGQHFLNGENKKFKYLFLKMCYTRNIALIMLERKTKQSTNYTTLTKLPLKFCMLFQLF